MGYFDKYIAAGTQQTQLLFLDSDNLVTGDTRSAPASGATGSGAYNVIGIQEMSAGIPEGENVPVPGDDTTLGAFPFASDAPREFILNVGQFDLTLNARLQNTNVVQVAGASMGVGDSPEVQPASVCLIVQGHSIKRTTGQAGQAAWTGFIMPVVTVRPLDRAQYQGRTAGVNRYQCTVQLATNYPYGITFASNVEGVLTDYIIPFSSDYPMTLDAFLGNGITATFTLSKTPVSTAYTAPYLERVLQAMTSVTPSTKALVLSAIPAANRRLSVFYGFSGL